MEQFLKILSVLFIGSLELWAAVPAGLAMNLHPLIVAAATSTGGIGGAVIIVLLGERMRGWFSRRYVTGRADEKPGIVRRIWDRYGVIGLGLLAPLLTGVPIGVGIGIVLGAPSGKLLWWSSVGTVLWTIGLTVAGAVGKLGIERLFG